VAFDDRAQFLFVADVGLDRAHVGRGQLSDPRRVTVCDGDLVVAGRAEKVDDGVADLAGAEECESGGHGQSPAIRNMSPD